MPKSEDSEITDDEYLLRRVAIGYFSKDKTLKIDMQAFRPVSGPNARTPDTDGISLFRESCLLRPDDVLEGLSAEKKARIGVVRLSVKLIRDLGLTIEPRPVQTIPGHVVIRELNSDAVTNAREMLKRMQAELAIIASAEGNVVVRP